MQPGRFGWNLTKYMAGVFSLDCYVESLKYK